MHRIARGLLALLLSLPFAGAGEAGFRVAPTAIRFRLAAGDSGSSEIIVQNAAERPCCVRARVEDFRFDLKGVEETLALGTLERSLAPWLSLGPTDSLFLGAFAADTLGLSVALPETAEGSYWVKLTLMEETTGGDLTGMREVAQSEARQEFAVRVFADALGTESRRARIVVLETGPSSDRPVLRVDVGNEGNSILRCSARLELRDEVGRVATKIAFARFALFPEASLVLSARPESALAAGSYTARAVLDYGGEHLVDSEIALVIGEQRNEP
jgi:hypothetical protein